MTMMSGISNPIGPLRDPIREMLRRKDDSVLALIVGVDGPAYRPVGAAMAVFPDGSRVGTLSSGCVEHDIALHALNALKDGKPSLLRYGRGSDYMDLKLPCGGGLEVLILPRPDRAVLGQHATSRAERQPSVLEVDFRSGQLTARIDGETHRTIESFRVRYDPEIRFLVFGKGPEATTFSALVESLGYPGLLLSPDAETLECGRRCGFGVRHLARPEIPPDVAIDRWSAAVLFFHDHDWEPPILSDALNSEAFYIGAQGSRKAAAARVLALESIGVSPETCAARLRGPIGLIPSARDAGTLAVSVLAEVLALNMLVKG